MKQEKSTINPPNSWEWCMGLKIGDKVIVAYDLILYGRPYYNTVKGDVVTITNFHIYANGAIYYYIDSPKLRKVRKGYDVSDDSFPEFHLEYKWEKNQKIYNL